LDTTTFPLSKTLDCLFKLRNAPFNFVWLISWKGQSGNRDAQEPDAAIPRQVDAVVSPLLCCEHLL
jgi:hypothetical protein